ncbi:hypothetical protein [Nonomuraea sp. NPDC049646]|uniref:hypothetical protein n=1 Tax=unclassified Nonomuraea TaxID=2593643 RepID=UPI0037BACEBC
MSRFISKLGWPNSRASRERRQIAVTADDVKDIQVVAQAAMDADALTSYSPKVTVTPSRGGAIVQATETHQFRPAWLLRTALEQMGYVVSRHDFAANAVVVTGRDPQHAWNEADGSSVVGA